MFPRFQRRLALRARRFRRDESGQALLAVGILSLALILFATSVFPIGNGVRRRIRAQCAADASALATGVWAARGCNVVNACNALSYDIHVVYHLIINGMTVKWIVEIVKDLDTPIVGPILAIGDWFEGRKEITQWWKSLSYANNWVDAGVESATPGYNHLALSEANEIARLMGASKIGKDQMEGIFSSLGLEEPSGGFEDAEKKLKTFYGTGTFLASLRDTFKRVLGIVPLVGRFISKLADLIPEPKSGIDLYCWPLSPDARPAKAYETTRLVNWGKGGYPPEAGRTVFLHQSPTYTEPWDPFALDLFFLKFFSWKAKYARLAGEVDGKKANLESDGIRYTTAVRFDGTDPADGWLPALAAGWFGGDKPVTAVSSVHLKGDRLTDAGCKTSRRIYFSMAVLAIPIWPLPIVRAPAYGGEFDYEPCPVVFRKDWKSNETTGEGKLIFH